MKEEYLGYMKFEGDSVKEGYLDMRKSAEALTGFDEAIRYFLARQHPDLGRIEFEIPVRIEKGSWVAHIPEILLGVVTITSTAYLSSAAAQLAKNDFKDVTLGELIKRALVKMQAVVRVAKHMDGFGKKIEKLLQQEDGMLVIQNAQGATLNISKEDLDAYIESPKNLMSKMADVVSEDRTLKLGVRRNGSMHEEAISVEDKGLFATLDDDEEELFPELKDGQLVTLEGKVTRENEKTDSVGLEYQGHILSCYPETGNVKKYKPCLFLRCSITGVVKRGQKTDQSENKKPRIYFSSLVPLEQDPANTQIPLL